jgi:hypothetical protein
LGNQEDHAIDIKEKNQSKKQVPRPEYGSANSRGGPSSLIGIHCTSLLDHVVNLQP